MTPYIAVVAIHLGYVALYIGAWNWVFIFVYVLHLILFYPGWVFVYNEFPDSHIRDNQLDFYNHLNFWMISFVIAMIGILPIMFIKQGKSMFFPRLIDLVMRKKIHEDIDIESKLKIDMVKLEKELDSDIDDDDHSVRMSQGLANQVRTSNHETIENINMKGVSSVNSEVESINDHKLGEDDVSSLGGESGMDKSQHHAKSSNSLMKSQSINPSQRYRLTQSLRKNPSKASPKFEKFSEHMLEVRGNSSKNSKSTKNSQKKMRKANRTSFGKRKKTDQFHPKLSSVGANTIHEKSEEEDKEESSINSRLEEDKQEGSDLKDSSSEEREESSSEAASQIESDNKYSLEASSMADANNFRGHNQRGSILDNMDSKFHNKRTLEVSDIEE